jgi:hypothetical protein
LPERKSRSGTVLSFKFWVLSLKDNINAGIYKNQFRNGELCFSIFVQAPIR